MPLVYVSQLKLWNLILASGSASRQLWLRKVFFFFLIMYLNYIWIHLRLKCANVLLITGVYGCNICTIYMWFQCTDEPNSYPFYDKVIRLFLEQLGKCAWRQTLGWKSNLSYFWLQVESGSWWQEHTELYQKKCLNDLDNHDGVVTHIEPDIWSAKSSGPEEALLWTKLMKVIEFQLSYFKS